MEFARDTPALRPHFPKLIHIDHRHQFMIQDFVDGQQFADVILDVLPARIELARQFGATLALIHEQMRPLFESADDHEGTTRPAWILSPHRIWTRQQIHRNSSLIGFAAVLQQFPEVETALDATSELWERNAWIHHDVKMSNCILSVNEKADSRIVLVDWELARLGDNAWDLAGMLHSIVGDSIIRNSGNRNSKDTDVDEQPLETIFRVTSAMCDAYLQAAETPAADRDAFLRRCLAYAGARLVQLASECQSNRRMTSKGLRLLQAGLNLMQKPNAFANMVGLVASDE